MNRINTIPKPLEPVISLGKMALTGALTVGDEVELAQNSAAKIAANLHDLSGNPATPEIPGKQLLYAAQKALVSEAYIPRNEAIRAGREFCRLAIGVLKAEFGSRWNTQWNAAGFTAPTLELPADPLVMLNQFRQYFTPDKEIPALQLTAEKAQALFTAIIQAHSAVAAARAELLLRKAARDRALKALRARLSGLRAELAQLLRPEDGRWIHFGFRRPADGRKPEPVNGLKVTEAGPGIILAQWTPASRAESYRVTCKTGATTESRIAPDPQCAFTDIPIGPVTITVAARNATGESEAASAEVLSTRSSPSKDARNPVL